MNILDCTIIIALLCFILYGYSRGFASMLLGIASLALAVFLAKTLQPYISEVLMASPVYTAVKDSISTTLDMESRFSAYGSAAGEQVLASMTLPSFLKTDLLSNMPSVYDLLGISQLDDYISSALAETVISVISSVLVFIIVIVLMRVLTHAMKLVNKLPVIGSLNHMLGGVLGTLEGVLVCWLSVAVLAIFFAAKTDSQIAVLLSESTLARMMLENM